MPQHMIVIHVGRTFGMGDLAFGFKLASELRGCLPYYDGQIMVLLSANNKKVIDQADFSSAFKVNVLTYESLTEGIRNGEVVFDFFIKGPVHDESADALSYLEIPFPENLPILFIDEYCVRDAGIKMSQTHFIHSQMVRWPSNKLYSEMYSQLLCYGEYKDGQLKQREMLMSGFGTENGILISSSLLVAAQAKDMSAQSNAWLILMSLYCSNQCSQTLDDFKINYDLSFEYSHKENSCYRFLKIHSLYSQDKKKNQDIFVIGSDEKSKELALNKMLSELQQQFRTIQWISLKNQKSRDYTGNSASLKTLRVFYVPQVTYEQMTALQLLSDDVVGSTGDQSLSEAISLLKISVYEALPHKNNLASLYEQKLQELVIDDYHRKCVYLLFHAQKEEAYRELGKMLRTPTIITALREAHRCIATKENLATKVASLIRGRLEETRCLAAKTASTESSSATTLSLFQPESCKQPQIYFEIVNAPEKEEKRVKYQSGK